MITSHQVLQDTPLLHLAYLEFKAPFPSSETFQLPRQGRSWIWRVDFFDSQGDGVNDDLYIRGWHLKPPHLGELVNNPVTGHGYVRVDLLDLGPQFSRNAHNRHFDTLSSAIRSAPANGRRLWLRFQHTSSSKTVPDIPDLPDTGILVPPTHGVTFGGFSLPSKRKRTRTSRSGRRKRR